MSRSSGDFSPGISVVGSDGIALCDTYDSASAEIASCTLPNTDTYFIRAYASGGTGAGDYYLYLQRLNNPGSPVSIAYRQTLDGSIITPAEMDTFTFTASQGDKVLVRMSRSSGDFWPGISVVSPDGIALCDTYDSASAEIASCTLPNTGTYSILAYAFGGINTGDYQLYLKPANYPGAFVKSSPANGASNQSPNPTLVWSASSNAISYDYCYDTTNDNECTSWNDNGTATSKVLSGLSFNTTFYWQVRANNDDGTTTADSGTWSSFTIKPLVTKQFSSVGASDGWILETSETSNIGGALNTTATTFQLGDNATRKQYRAVLSFDTGASLPDKAVITSVTLGIKKSAVIGGGNPITAFQGIMVDIQKGFFGSLAGLQVSDFQATASKTLGPFSPTPVSNWYSMNLTGAKGYINTLSTSSGLTQIRLRYKLDDNNNAVANYISFYSGNGGATNKPSLTIQYYVP